MGADSHIEQYGFHCEPCQYEWQMTYEVRDVVGAPPASRHYAYLNGIPANPPSAGRRCPNCWAPTYAPQMVEVLQAVGRR